MPALPRADRLLRANSREKSVVAQLLFVSSLFHLVRQGGIILTWIYMLLRFSLCNSCQPEMCRILLHPIPNACGEAKQEHPRSGKTKAQGGD